jgi:hypothetical protein
MRRERALTHPDQANAASTSKRTSPADAKFSLPSEGVAIWSPALKAFSSIYSGFFEETLQSILEILWGANGGEIRELEKVVRGQSQDNVRGSTYLATLGAWACHLVSCILASEKQTSGEDLDGDEDSSGNGVTDSLLEMILRRPCIVTSVLLDILGRDDAAVRNTMSKRQGLLQYANSFSGGPAAPKSGISGLDLTRVNEAELEQELTYLQQRTQSLQSRYQEPCGPTKPPLVSASSSKWTRC